MLSKILKTLFKSLSGSNQHKYKKFSSSDYKKGFHRHNTHGHSHYGHSHYKHKHSSHSFFSS